MRYLCKSCGAEAPRGVGYVAGDGYDFPDVRPGCPGLHRVDVRKLTRFDWCERHARFFAGVTRRVKPKWAAEGGPIGECVGGPCRVFPGVDHFAPDVCTRDAGEYLAATYGARFGGAA